MVLKTLMYKNLDFSVHVYNPYNHIMHRLILFVLNQLEENRSNEDYWLDIINRERNKENSFSSNFNAEKYI